MPNPFKSKPGSKKLNDPVLACPLTKGEIDIEVYGVDPRGVLPREALQGAGLSVTGGPTATTGATTPANGQWRYQPLNAGGYTVAAAPSGELTDKYGVAPPFQVVLNAGQTVTSIFLIPWNWVEFFVHDTAGRPLPNIDWQLAHDAGGFKQYKKGATGADAKIYEKKVRSGTHRLTVKELTNPVWSGDAVIGEEIVLSADADGFLDGDAGTIEILDGYQVKTVLHTIPATVKSGSGTQRLEAKWKPAEGPFANLKHSKVQFRAKSGTAVVYSVQVSLLKAETLRFEDGKGHSVDRQVEFIFSGGGTETVTTASGKAAPRVPWGETLRGVRLAGLTVAHVKIEAGAVTGAVAV